MNKIANIAGEFEKNVAKLLTRKAKGYKGTGMLAGGLIGGGLGSLTGVADTARRQMQGELDYLSPEEKMQRYLTSAGRYGAYGAAAGGGLGLLKGIGNRSRAVEQQLEHMRPFLAGQLAEGASSNRLLSRIGDLADMHSASQIGKFTNKGLFDSVQENIAKLRPSGARGGLDEFMSSGGLVAEDALSALAKEEAKDAKALNFLNEHPLLTRFKAKFKKHMPWGDGNSAEATLVNLRKNLEASKVNLSRNPSSATIEAYNKAQQDLLNFTQGNTLLVQSRRNPEALSELKNLGETMSANQKAQEIASLKNRIADEKGLNPKTLMELSIKDPAEFKAVSEGLKGGFDKIKDLNTAQKDYLVNQLKKDIANARGKNIDQWQQLLSLDPNIYKDFHEQYGKMKKTHLLDALKQDIAASGGKNIDQWQELISLDPKSYKDLHAKYKEQLINALKQDIVASGGNDVNLWQQLLALAPRDAKDFHTKYKAMRTPP